MADDRRQQLADVLAAHRTTSGMKVSMGWTCDCGFWSPSAAPQAIEAHKIDALLPLLDRVAANAAAAIKYETCEACMSPYAAPSPTPPARDSGRDEAREADTDQQLIGSIEAVLELHRPHTHHTAAIGRHYCRECGFGYPCETVRLLT